MNSHEFDSFVRSATQQHEQAATRFAGQDAAFARIQQQLQPEAKGSFRLHFAAAAAAILLLAIVGAGQLQPNSWLRGNSTSSFAPTSSACDFFAAVDRAEATSEPMAYASFLPTFELPEVEIMGQRFHMPSVQSVTAVVEPISGGAGVALTFPASLSSITPQPKSSFEPRGHAGIAGNNAMLGVEMMFNIPLGKRTTSPQLQLGISTYHGLIPSGEDPITATVWAETGLRFPKKRKGGATDVRIGKAILSDNPVIGTDALKVGLQHSLRHNVQLGPEIIFTNGKAYPGIKLTLG